MALAKFFDKTALAASHILRGFEPELFSETLASKNIAVFFDKSAEDTREGRWTLELAVNLLARLYPKISILSPENSDLMMHLSDIAKAINPLIEIDHNLDDSSLCLVVGKSIPPVSALSFYIGSEGWIVKVSSQRPVSSTDTGGTVWCGCGSLHRCCEPF